MDFGEGEGGSLDEAGYQAGRVLAASSDFPKRESSLQLSRE